MLDVRRAIGRQRQRRLFSAAGLNTGLFVRADDVIIGTQWSALPDTLVKIEDGSGFCGKVRIARKDPASMFPGAKGIAAEPAPQSSAADLSDQALGNNVLADLQLKLAFVIEGIDEPELFSGFNSTFIIPTLK
jgi:hypothetical protein